MCYFTPFLRPFSEDRVPGFPENGKRDSLFLGQVQFPEGCHHELGEIRACDIK